VIYEPQGVFIAPKLVEIVKEVLPDVEPEQAYRQIIEAFSRDDSKLLVFEKDDEVQAFILATEEEFEGEPIAFIQLCACRAVKNEKWVVQEMFSRLRKWGASRNLDYVYTVVHRNPRPFMRKYKFKFHGTVLRRATKNV